MIFHFLRKNNHSIRVLQGFFLLVSMMIFFVPWTWTALAVMMYVVLETLGGNIGLHRYYGHRSFKTTPAWDRILCFFAHYVGVGSVVSWVGQHRYHHKHSDTDADVHSPRHQGIWNILFGIWSVKIPRAMIRDVVKDKRLMWWNKHYWHLHLTLIFVYLAIDLMFGTYTLYALYALPNLMCLISGYVLAIVTHYHGYKTHDIGDEATNSWLANIYTLGEGWHNNHHAYPARLRQGEKWWEWDLPAFVVEKFIATESK